MKKLAIPLHALLEAAELLMENTHFIFIQKFFQQVYFTEMGSNASEIKFPWTAVNDEFR